MHDAGTHSSWDDSVAELMAPECFRLSGCTRNLTPHIPCSFWLTHFDISRTRSLCPEWRPNTDGVRLAGAVLTSGPSSEGSTTPAEGVTFFTVSLMVGSHMYSGCR
jgi:hypothetical protein